MTNILRWLRGALGVGLTWAALWVVFGILFGTVIWIVDPKDIGPGEGPSTALPILGLVGFLSHTGVPHEDRRCRTGSVQESRSS